MGRGMQIMNLVLVKAEERYRKQITEYMEEWMASGEPIVPKAVGKHDVHDFAFYCQNLEVKEPHDGLVPDSTYFCLDQDRDIIVGAVNIRHYLNASLLRTVGHIGDGVRPGERRKGYATAMIALALEKCRALGIDKVLMVCDRTNLASARSIIRNGGVLENELEDNGRVMQRYWIDLKKEGKQDAGAA